MPNKRDLPFIVTKLRKFYHQYRRMPTYKELADLMGYASKRSSALLVSFLIEEGIIEKDETGKIIPKKLTLPLPVFGDIQAGWPSPAEEELVDTISLDEYLISNPQASFFLRVSGDSMIEAGVMPGDLVIIERGKKPKNGDIVLAQVDGQWTLKYFENKRGKIALVSANRKYPPIYPKEELVITGVVRAVVRKY